MNSIENKLALELTNGNFAIIQSWGESENCISARVGFIKPGMKCLEYITLNNWVPKYKGKSLNVNKWLKTVYSENSDIIKKRLSDLIH